MNRVWLWVDVRDIALAHVLAAVSPECRRIAPSTKAVLSQLRDSQESAIAGNHRYLVTAGNYSAQQFIDYIWEHYPERATSKNIPRGTPGRLYPEEGVYKADNSKSKKDLGLEYRGFETMLKDMLARFEELESETGVGA